MSPPFHRSIESEERATDARTRSLLLLLLLLLFSFASGAVSFGEAPWRQSLSASKEADEKRALSFEIQWKASTWPPVVRKRAPGSLLPLLLLLLLLPLPPPLPPRANASEVSSVAAAASAILASVARGEAALEPSFSERSWPTEAASEERDQEEAAAEQEEGEERDEREGEGEGEEAAAAAAEAASAG